MMNVKKISNYMRKAFLLMGILAATTVLPACSGNKTQNNASAETETTTETPKMLFSADSAYIYVKKQTEFGPRVPNTAAHRNCGDWLEGELRRHGANVVVQSMKLKAFDGTTLDTRNIMGQYNPGSADRLLLMAHWDTRPWADNDPDEANHKKPMDGANDGASGVGVLLEVARQLAIKNPSMGIDILFLDAEDWGSHDRDDSWALGADYFVKNPILPDYKPSRAILVDMVGGKGSQFYREQHGEMYARGLNDAIWTIAMDSRLNNYFMNQTGGAVTDDHVKFLEAGIPAIDIIAFDPASDSGFPATWHTMQDNMENIDAQVLGAVGQTLLNYIYK